MAVVVVLVCASIGLAQERSVNDGMDLFEALSLKVLDASNRITLGADETSLDASVLDLNGDGMVNEHDVNSFADMDVIPTEGDLNGDGLVNDLDLDEFSNRFIASLPPEEVERVVHNEALDRQFARMTEMHGTTGSIAPSADPTQRSADAGDLTFTPQVAWRDDRGCWEGGRPDVETTGLFVGTLGEDIEFAYDSSRDLNGDGYADGLDFHLLKAGVAEVMAGGGGVLMWNGRPVDPARRAVYFDGAMLIGAGESTYRRVLSEDGASPREDGSNGCSGAGCADCECQVNDFRDAQEIYVTFETGLRCHCYDWIGCLRVHPQTLLHEVEITITPGYYGHDAFQFACMMFGVQEYHRSASSTTQSHVKASLGQKVDDLLNMVVEWGHSTTNTTTETVIVRYTATPNYDEELRIRHTMHSFQITITQLGEPRRGTSCLSREDSDSDTIYHGGYQTAVTRCGPCECEPPEPT